MFKLTLPLRSYIINSVVAFTLMTLFTITGNYFFSPVSKYFVYSSIVPLKEHITIGEPLYFISDIERFRVTNMHYEDTLRCGFTPNDLFWYSQVTGDFARAPIGKKISQWKYSGETPTVPMICQLSSLPSVNLIFGINTEPQVIEGPFFYFEDPIIDLVVIPEPLPKPIIRAKLPIPLPIIPKAVKLTPPTIQSVLDANK